VRDISIPVVHRLCGDDRQQAVFVDDLLGVARLQRRQRRQELAFLVHEAQHVGHVSERQLFVEGVWLTVVLGLGAATCQCRGRLVVVEVRQLASAQFAIEGQPLRVQLVGQFVELLRQWPSCPGDIQLPERRNLSVGRDEFGAQVAMLLTVVDKDLARVQTPAQLAVDPELVAVGLHAGGLAVAVEGQKVGTQTLRHAVFRAFAGRPLREALLLREYVFTG
jgi:hypothetical protein